ncbi:sulfatase-like hydrolase/transferase [Starkeya koreensis]|uniref:Sulfatase-like hydrolase/transferase n=1 Tax=Ancylobacter koreensis TaxID=266121 RepID=A0ABT0DKF6_9HYPH|nr:sulfatase-like hydrolase/transferase [Ancylobacter koreensis]MCK0207772.1 sulfatase-like hydrolase/transferase [Ancylobacter koreensis]
MMSTPPTSRPRRNLFVFHLESISWQTLNAFPEAFPNLHALMGEARSYRSHFASASSSQMVIAAFLHGNDFEMDRAEGIATPAGNNPSLFATLEAAGYRTSLLCASAYPQRPLLRILAGSLPTAWSTSDFGALLARVEAEVADGPFAIYVWCQVPHIEANLALASHAAHLDDLLAGGCAVADNLLGAMVELLRRAGTLDDTTLVAYGDHGDDFGTHGFKSGMLHGTEPYTSLIHTPLVIRDAALAAGTDHRLVSTVDLAPTCLELLGFAPTLPFVPSGRSVLSGPPRGEAFSQNLTANQPDMVDDDVRQCFAAVDRSHALLVTRRGLELYNHRLDPGNHANLLHHFEFDAEGRLRLLEPKVWTRPHFRTVHHLWRTGLLQESALRLRDSLRAHVAAKNDYVRAGMAETKGERGEPGPTLLDMSAFDRINRIGRGIFFDSARAPESHPEAESRWRPWTGSGPPGGARARPRWKKLMPRFLRRLFNGRKPSR